MKVTMIERSPGAWRLRIEHGRDASGRRLFKYETFHGSRDDAERRRFTILNEHEQNTFALPDKTTVAGYFGRRVPAPFGEWVTSRLALGKISRSTAENYQTMLDAYFVPVLGAKRLQHVAGIDVQGCYTQLAGRASLSTVAHLHRVLTVAFASIRRARLVKSNPMEEVEPPGSVRPKPYALTEDQVVDVLLPALEGQWLAPMVFVGLGTGMRRGEVLGLRWKDLELERAKLYVRGQIVQYKRYGGALEWKAPKTAAGVRDVDLPAELVDMFRRLKIEALERNVKLGLGRDIAERYVFTLDGEKPIRPDRLTNAFTALCDTIGLPGFTFHKTRHTHGTALLRKVGREGAKAVSQRLGHASIEITLGTYQAVFEEDRRQLGDMASGLLGRRVQNVPKTPGGSR